MSGFVEIVPRSVAWIVETAGRGTEEEHPAKPKNKADVRTNKVDGDNGRRKSREAVLTTQGTLGTGIIAP